MDKNQLIKMALLHMAKAFALPIIIGVVIIVLISSFTRALHFSNSTEMEESYNNFPHVSREYERGIEYTNDGTAKAQKTATEILKEMDNKEADIARTFDAEELKEILNTENICNILDTRKNPDKNINWKSNELSNPGKTEIQGLVKINRALSDGEKVRMTYVTPEELESYIDDYKANPTEKNKKKALSYYTIELENLKVEAEEESIIETEEIEEEKDDDSLYGDIKGEEESFYCLKVAKCLSKATTIELEEKPEDKNKFETQNESGTETEFENENELEIKPPKKDIKYSSTDSMCTVDINYKEFIKQIAMPNEFLNVFYNVSELKEFTLDLLKLAYDGEIECTIFDNIGKETGTNIEEIPAEKDEYGNIIKEAYTKTTTTSEYKDFIGFNLTDAKVWFLDYKVNYDYVKVADNEKEIGYYELSDPEVELKLKDKDKKEDFFEKIEKYPEAKINLLSGREILLDIIMNHDLIKNFYPVSEYVMDTLKEEKPEEVNLKFYYPPIIKWEKEEDGFNIFTIWPERYDDEYKKVELIKENKIED